MRHTFLDSKRLPRLALLVLLAVGSPACQDNHISAPLPPSGVNPPSISPPDTTVQTRDSVKYTVTPRCASGIDCSYHLSTTIGTITQDGWLRGLTAPGTGTVKVTMNADTTKVATATITVRPRTVTSPQLDWVRFVDFGGTKRDDAFSVTLDNQGNIVVGGIKWELNSSTLFGAFASFDTLGNQRWVTEINSPSGITTLINSGGTIAFGGFNGTTPQALCGTLGSSGNITLQQN